MAKGKRIPAWLPIHNEGEGTAYIPVAEVLVNAELSSQITDKAIAELQAWHSQWANVLELIHENHPTAMSTCAVKLVDDFKQLKRTNKKHWPI